MDRKYFLMLGMVLLGSGVYLFIFPSLSPLALIQVCEIDYDEYSDTFGEEVCVYRRDTSVPEVDPDEPYNLQCPTDHYLSSDGSVCIPFSFDEVSWWSSLSLVPVALILGGVMMVTVYYRSNES